MGWRAAGEGRYTNTVSGGQIAEAAYFVITMLAMLAVALHFSYLKGHPSTGLRYLNLILSGAWAIRVLIAGDRNAFLLIAITAFIGYYTYVRKVNWIFIGVAAALSFTYYGLAETLRSSDPTSWLSVLTGSSGITSEGSETSFNITTISVRAGLAAVPESVSYGLGFFKLVGIMGVIPFSRNLFLQGSDIFTSTSEILSEALLSANRTWDVGTNIVSDSYIDFGLPGVIAILFLVGRVSASISELAKTNESSVWFRTLYLVTASLFAELPRYSADFPVRTLLWIWFIFWCMSKVSPPQLQMVTERPVLVTDARKSETS
jgi:oligosaccharide repeat unit polymerase